MHVSVGLTVTVLAVFAAAVLAQTCTRDTYSTSADPQFPSTDLPAQYSSYLTREFVQGHWSELAQMLRPAEYTPPVSPLRVDCPHLQTGLKDWHNASIWSGGSVPAAGADVTLPENSKVLISSCSVSDSVIYGKISIPATSELIFGDANINLRTKGITVNGAIKAGSATCRLQKDITITLHGSRSAQAFPAPLSTKGIAVQNNGSLDLHGVKFFPTWTRLSTSAIAGDTVIFVQDLVNWKSGQSILITSTELRDARDWHRNEVRNITAVYKVSSIGSNVAAIVLNSAVTYTHYAGKEYQAEVALLSRNIVVQGDETNSEPTDNTPLNCTWSEDSSLHPCPDNFLTGFGGHIHIGGTGASGRAAGVRLYRMGQTNLLGRYPFHIHEVGANANKSYIIESTVERSFYRCYVVHASHGTLVSENVAYDAIGHCYYLESGVEENNTLSYNLAAHVHYMGIGHWSSQKSYYGSQTLFDVWETSTLTLPADITASGFYIPNSYNSIYGNAASGGWSGYAFPMFLRPSKEHRWDPVTPLNRPLKLFKGNTAHSTSFWWLQGGGIYIGGLLTHASSTNDTLLYNPGRTTSYSRNTCKWEPMLYNQTYCPTWIWPNGNDWMRFEDNKIFLVAGRGIQHWGTRSEYLRFECHDCGLAMNVFGQVWMNESLINCRSNNSGNLLANRYFNCPAKARGTCNYRDYSFWQQFGGFQWYDVGQTHIVTNTIFRNCHNRRSDCFNGLCSSSAVWSLLTHSDQFVPEMMQATKGIVYENANSTYLWRFSTALSDKTGNTVSGRLQNWFDADGSVSGIFPGHKTSMGSNWSKLWWKLREEDCVEQSQMWVCKMKSNDTVASILFRHNAYMTSQIGSTMCMNGGGVYQCPIVGQITSFGKSEGSHSLDLGATGKVTGPIIEECGGWFLRFNNSMTPRALNVTQMQIPPTSVLLLAIPYPKATEFSIVAKGASYCSAYKSNVCTVTFNQTDSIMNVYNSDGSKYFFDRSTGILYIRLVQQLDTSLGSSNVWKVKNETEVPYFTRDSVRLPVPTGSGYTVYIFASNCGSTNSLYCDGNEAASNPAMLFPPEPVIEVTESPAPSSSTTGGSDPSSQNDNSIGIIAGSVAGGIVLLGGVTTFVYLKFYRRTSFTTKATTIKPNLGRMREI